MEEKVLAGAVYPDENSEREKRNHFYQNGFYGEQGTPPHGRIEVYRIKNRRTGKYLQGWFRISVAFKFKSESVGSANIQNHLKMMILWARDDHWRRQNIGEFSWEFPDSVKVAGNGCPKNDATKYMIISCGGASRSEPLVSNMILWVRNASELDGPIYPKESAGLHIVPKKDGEKEFNFYVRIPIQDCNQKKMIYFRARFMFDKKHVDTCGSNDLCIREAGYYWHIRSSSATGTYIPGGTDALPSPSQARQLDCDEKLEPSFTGAAESESTRQIWYVDTTAIGNAYDEYNNFHNSLVSPHIDQRPDQFGIPLYACQSLYFQGRCYNNYRSMHVKYFTNYAVEQRELMLVKNQNTAEENIIPICESQLTFIDQNIEGGNRDKNYYLPPTKFNNVSVSFLRTDAYLQDKAKSGPKCTDIYHKDPHNCQISTIKATTRSINTIAVQNHPTQRSIQRQKYFRRANARDDKDEDSENQTSYKNYSGNGRDPIKDRLKGVGFNETGFTKLIWGLRKGHGAVLSWAALFVIPVNHFVTRYFKESFMDSRILYTHVWYQVHMHGIFITAVLLMAGWILAYCGKRYLGTSLTVEAGIHRGVGYLAIILFVVQTVLGGLRGFYEPLRSVTITLHWALGVLFYLLMLVEMMSAVLIPGCGVAHHDRSMLWVDTHDEYMVLSSGSFWHIIIWLLVELVMHLVMTTNMCLFDLKMGIVQRRKYFPVPLPVIKEHCTQNASVSGYLICASCWCTTDS